MTGVCRTFAGVWEVLIERMLHTVDDVYVAGNPIAWRNHDPVILLYGATFSGTPSEMDSIAYSIR